MHSEADHAIGFFAKIRGDQWRTSASTQPPRFSASITHVGQRHLHLYTDSLVLVLNRTWASSCGRNDAILRTVMCGRYSARMILQRFATAVISILTDINGRWPKRDSLLKRLALSAAILGSVEKQRRVTQSRCLRLCQRRCELRSYVNASKRLFEISPLMRWNRNRDFKPVCTH